MRDVPSELLQWSLDRPAWQRDALRRILTSKDLSQADIGELTELCKGARGLVEPLTSEPLGPQHVAIRSQHHSPVRIMDITHHRGVNALAPEQTISFSPNLTLVYGSNAAGKSGYTRILKRACRSRGIENILGNVLSGKAPLTPQATIRFRDGLAEHSFPWASGSTVSDALARISVFDSHCASVYLKDKTDVAFRPFGLDVFDKLSAVCSQVRVLLEAEQRKIEMALVNLPSLPQGTRARTLLEGLTSLTKVETVKGLAELSPQEEARLQELNSRAQDLKSTDPKQRSRDLRLKSERVNRMVRHIKTLTEALGDAVMGSLQSAVQEVRAASQALSVVQKTALTPGLLPGTGETVWRNMWEAAGAFAVVAFPGQPFPSVGSRAQCPLCQQVLEPDAANRLTHFAEYIASKAQGELQRAERTRKQILAAVDKCVVKAADVDAILEEIRGDDAGLATELDAFLQGAQTLQQVIRATDVDAGGVPTGGVGAGPVAKLTAVVTVLQDRSRQLEKERPTLDPALAVELNELTSRVMLRDTLHTILGEIERKKRIAAYRQCIDDTSTQAITRKSTELTKDLVTEQLANSFKDELSRVEFNHLAVEVQVAGGAKGVLHHRLAFATAPNIPVTDVLSEGEARTLSLCAFLTELSTAGAKSGIIFDDPVSSLDHVWRARIARRLVEEAKDRQVIIFTHDLLFLRVLLAESSRQEVVFQHQYVRREGAAGICSPDLPWIAMNVKQRIGSLRNQYQAAEKTSRISGSEAYEREAREIYGLLRETWELALGEVLLNDVIERYRPSIETHKAKFLHDITENDCKGLEDGMTECSKWMRGHDHAVADGTPFPAPADLRQRVDDLEAWVKTIRARRKS